MLPPEYYLKAKTQHPPCPHDILGYPCETNPIVHACVAVWQRGECTWEQAMMYAVLELAKVNAELIRAATKTAMLTTKADFMRAIEPACEPQPIVVRGGAPPASP